MSTIDPYDIISILLIGMGKNTFADLSLWFREKPDYCILANLPSLKSITTFAYKPIDVALVDLDVQDSEKIDSWVEFCHCLRQTRVVALYNDVHHQQVQLAYISGIRYFIAKQSNWDANSLFYQTLLRTLKNPGLPEIVPSWINERQYPIRSDQLTPADGREGVRLASRDLEILSLLTMGATNDAIARHLHLSRKTVKNRISNILDQLSLNNRTQAALWAYQHGFGPT